MVKRIGASPLGRIQLHDPRSRDYAFQNFHRGAAQRSVRHAMNAPNVDQFYTSGCVGFSGTNMLNCAAAVRSRRKMNDWMEQVTSNKYLNNDAGIENYHQATVFDPFPGTYPPDDNGSSALGLMKFWRAYGIITGYEWAFTFDQFLAALQRQPVLVGTNWYEDMMKPDRLGRISPTGDNVGGHEYLVDQIIWKTKYVGLDNSWGESWGLGGRAYIHFDYIEDLIFGQGGDVAIPRFL